MQIQLFNNKFKKPGIASYIPLKKILKNSTMQIITLFKYFLISHNFFASPCFKIKKKIYLGFFLLLLLKTKTFFRKNVVLYHVECLVLKIK